MTTGVTTAEDQKVLCIKPDSTKGAMLATLTEDETFRSMTETGSVELVRIGNGAAYRTPHQYYVLVVRGATETIGDVLDWVKLRLARLRFIWNDEEINLIDRNILGALA